MELASHCINCGLPVETAYCGACGQPHPPKKLTVRTLWFDFQSRIYGLDGMLPRTLGNTTVRPGVVAQEFIDGNRRKYYGPVGYFFLMVTLFLIIMSFFDVGFAEFTQAANMSPVKQGSGQEQFSKMISEFIADNLRTFSFMMIPIMALSAKIFFRKSKYNFLEHAVLPLYVLGHLYWVTIVMFLLYAAFDVSLNPIVNFLFAIPFYCYACAGFYTNQSKTRVVIKAFFAYWFSYIILVLFTSIVTIVIIISSPELRNMIKPGSS